MEPVSWAGRCCLVPDENVINAYEADPNYFHSELVGWSFLF